MTVLTRRFILMSSMDTTTHALKDRIESELETHATSLIARVINANPNLIKTFGVPYVEISVRFGRFIPTGFDKFAQTPHDENEISNPLTNV